MDCPGLGCVKPLGQGVESREAGKVVHVYSSASPCMDGIVNLVV